MGIEAGPGSHPSPPRAFQGSRARRSVVRHLGDSLPLGNKWETITPTSANTCTHIRAGPRRSARWRPSRLQLLQGTGPQYLPLSCSAGKTHQEAPWGLAGTLTWGGAYAQPVNGKRVGNRPGIRTRPQPLETSPSAPATPSECHAPSAPSRCCTCPQPPASHDPSGTPPRSGHGRPRPAKPCGHA